MEKDVNNGGAIKDTIDSRDIPFEFFVGADDDCPEAFDWREKYPIKHKHQNGSRACTGFTMSSYAEVLNWEDEGKYVELSPRWIYAFISLGKYKGAYTRDAAMRWLHKGIAPESHYNSYPATEEQMTDTGGLNELVERLALQYKAKVATAIQNRDNFDLLCLAIFQNKGITFGIGNHVMYCPAYNENYLICHDSLTGQDRFISRADVESGKGHSMWTIVDLKNNDMEYRDFVNAVTMAVAGRPADDGDFKVWIPALESGKPPHEVIQEFLNTEAKFETGDVTITIKKN